MITSFRGNQVAASQIRVGFCGNHVFMLRKVANDDILLELVKLLGKCNTTVAKHLYEAIIYSITTFTKYIRPPTQNSWRGISVLDPGLYSQTRSSSLNNNHRLRKQLKLAQNHGVVIYVTNV